MIRRSTKGSQFAVRSSRLVSFLGSREGKGGASLLGAARMGSAFARPSSVVRLTPDYGGRDRATGFMGNGELRTENGEPLVVAGVAPKG